MKRFIEVKNFMVYFIFIFCIKMIAASLTLGNEFPFLKVISYDHEPEVALYVACDLKAKCEGYTFVDIITLTYEVCSLNIFARELILTLPLPHEVKVKHYSVRIGEGPIFESVVYPKCVGEKVYEDTKAEDACGKSEISQDMLTISFKIPVQEIKGQRIVFELCWTHPLIQSFHPKHIICYEYIFPRQSYFKYGASLSRNESNLVKNRYGIAHPSALVDLKDCYFDLVDEAKGFIKEGDRYVLSLDQGEFHDNIRFSFINKTTEKRDFKPFRFKFDDLNVVGISFISQLQTVVNGFNQERELIFVLDRSGSMAYFIENVLPYRILQSALDHILTACSDSCVYFNLVVFNDRVGKEDILFDGSIKLVTPGIVNEQNDSKSFSSSPDETFKTLSVQEVKRMIIDRRMLNPCGGTDILEGIKKACNIKKLRTNQGKIVPRNIILLTDGGDNNLNNIKDFVIKKVKEDDTRFFSIGVGNGVSFDIIEAIGNLGNGLCSYIWNLKDLKDTFFEIVKQTGVKSKKFKWGPGSSVQFNMSFIKDGKLCIKTPTEGLHFPVYDSHQLLYPTKNKTLFTILRELPEFINFSFDDEKFSIPIQDIEEIKGELKMTMQDELAYEIDQSMQSEINKKLELAMINNRLFGIICCDALKVSEFKDKFSLILKEYDIIDHLKEKIDFDINQKLLTEDTLLMVGTEIKQNIDWKNMDSIDNMLTEQLVRRMENDKLSYPLAAKYKGLNAVAGCSGRTRSANRVLTCTDSVCRTASGSKTQFHDAKTGLSIPKEGSENLFDGINQQFESTLTFNQTCDALFVYFERCWENMLDDLKLIFSEIHKFPLNDADKKLLLLIRLYTKFVKNPNKVQGYIMLSKYTIARGQRELQKFLIFE